MSGAVGGADDDAISSWACAPSTVRCVTLSDTRGAACSVLRPVRCRDFPLQCNEGAHNAKRAKKLANWHA